MNTSNSAIGTRSMGAVLTIGAALILTMATSGCSKDARRTGSEPVAPTMTQVPTTETPQSVTPASPAGGERDPDIVVLTIIAVDIDTKLAVMCGLPQSKVFFKFDSAKLVPEAKERLQQIAACAISGAAKGKDLVVIGRTDPIGTDAYNKQLGMSRAESVTKYLRDQGLTKTRVETESKGETTASPDPFGWPYDRRVTVRLQS